MLNLQVITDFEQTSRNKESALWSHVSYNYMHEPELLHKASSLFSAPFIEFPASQEEFDSFFHTGCSPWYGVALDFSILKSLHNSFINLLSKQAPGHDECDGEVHNVQQNDGRKLQL